jgi:hypothetical protein
MLKMTQNEALSFLGIDEISMSKDAIEAALFDLKNQLFSSSHLPQLLDAKRNKLLKLKEVAEVLNLLFSQQLSDIQIQNNDSPAIMESFEIYQKNESIIKQKIILSNDINVLLTCIDLLLENLKTWCFKWSKINFEQVLDVKISIALDNMGMLQCIKELNQKEIIFFDQLNESILQNKLKIEISRLIQLSNFLNKN